MQHLSPGQRQRDQHHDNRQAGHDRPAENLINSGVEKRLFLFAAPHAQILPDAIEDDDSVGEGIPRKGQQSGHDKERNLLIQQVKSSQHREHIVKGGKSSRHTEAKFESHPDIQDDPGK